jgi:hypothetical protein
MFLVLKFNEGISYNAKRSFTLRLAGTLLLKTTACFPIATGPSFPAVFNFDMRVFFLLKETMSVYVFPVMGETIALLN